MRGNASAPWNAKADAGRLADGIPPELDWASDPAGINRVGCIYTAQGFEFDYVGVILGRDLRWDPASEEWVGDPSESFDSIVKRSGARFTDLVKRTYRVLLTRGMKGCYVYVTEPAGHDRAPAQHRSIRAGMNIRNMALRHHGLTSAMAEDYALAAEVCLARAHEPSSTEWLVVVRSVEHRARVEWQVPDATSRRAYANDDDATRDGAYCIALAAAEEHMGLVALRRAYTRTGADWILIPAGSEVSAEDELDLDRDDLHRFEVSGIGRDDAARLRARMREKLDQLREGASILPGLAGVVGFESATVLIEEP